MKRVAAWLASLCVCTLASCGGGGRGGELRVFNWGDYIGPTTVQDFATAHGVSVTYDNYSSNEELMAKLETGAAYDVVFPSAYAVEALIQRGALSKIDKALVPNTQYVMEEFRAPAFDPQLEYCIPYTWSTTGLGCDVSVVPETACQSWDVLFDERYRGRVLMLDDVRAAMGVALKRLGLSVNSTAPSDLARAREMLVAQKPLVRVYAGSNIPRLLASREVAVAYAWSGDILQAASLNDDVRFVVPSSGTLLYVDYMCMPKASRNRAAAHAFVNFLLEPQVSLTIAESIHYATTNSGARRLAKGEVAALWTKLQGVVAQGKAEPVMNVGKALGAYDQAWRAVKAE